MNVPCSNKRGNYPVVSLDKSSKIQDPNYICYFLSKGWNIIDKNVFGLINSFLKHGRLPQELDTTDITLIPKKDNQEKVNDYRPSSLCNISYKFISKLLANRLCLVLLKITSSLSKCFCPK